jgi:hypothetical protein
MLPAGPIRNCLGGRSYQIWVFVITMIIYWRNIYILQNRLPKCFHFQFLDRIGVVMVSVLVSNAVDRGLRTKEYRSCIYRFSVEHSSLRSKSKDWLAQNQNNVSEWSDMSTRRLSFQWARAIKVQPSVLV